MHQANSFHPSPGPIPQHVGIIPDGGRRWAKAQGCTLQEAYIYTNSHLFQIANFLYQKNVKEISIYLSSIENFKRTDEEMSAYLGIVESALKNEIASLAHQRNLVVKISGDRQVFPLSLANEVNSLEKSTLNNTLGRLNLLMGYNPLHEIIQAIKSTTVPENFIRFLSVSTPVDIVFRSGGAPLLSNFLPLQSGYARLCFLNKLFNDLTFKDLEEALTDFANTERKFGE
jgi:undecaprenyl diphosphate synthase